MIDIIIKKEKPQVSVIIPTYNRGWVVKEAVDSVLAQNFKNFELIVVDDGSTDHTREILNAYRGSIKLFHQANKGVSAARNRGISEASGDCVAFLDSDDLWLQGKLSRQVEFFSQTPEALICQTEEIWIRDGVRVNPKKRHKKPSGFIFKPSLALCLVSPSAVMIKRSLLEAVGGFDETLPACEDYDLWLRISCRHPVYLINTPLIIKRGGHNDQLSASPGLDRYRIRAIQKVMESGLLTESQYLAAGKTLKDKCDIYASGCRKRGRTDEARYYTKLSDQYG